METTAIAKEIESEAWIDFQDCDPFGHLNNTRYLNYFMHARTRHLKDAYGFDIYQHTAQTGNGWVVAKTHLAYLAPAKYNETVRLRTRLLHTDALRLVPEAVMLNQQGDLVHALGWIEFIYVNTASGRPVKHSGELKAFLDSISVAAQWQDGSFTERLKELQLVNRARARLGAA